MCSTYCNLCLTFSTCYRDSILSPDGPPLLVGRWCLWRVANFLLFPMCRPARSYLEGCFCFCSPRWVDVGLQLVGGLGEFVSGNMRVWMTCPLLMGYNGMKHVTLGWWHWWFFLGQNHCHKPFPKITIRSIRCYKPFPNGGFMALFYPHDFSHYWTFFSTCFLRSRQKRFWFLAVQSCPVAGFLGWHRMFGWKSDGFCWFHLEEFPPNKNNKNRAFLPSGYP